MRNTFTATQVKALNAQAKALANRRWPNSDTLAATYASIDAMSIPELAGTVARWSKKLETTMVWTYPNLTVNGRTHTYRVEIPSDPRWGGRAFIVRHEPLGWFPAFGDEDAARAAIVALGGIA
jgi:hypothetical protein